MSKMCFQFFAKDVITSTKFEYFETDAVFAMTIQSNLCIFRLSAIIFQLSPFAEHCGTWCIQHFQGSVRLFSILLNKSPFICPDIFPAIS